MVLEAAPISREHFLEMLGKELYNMFWFPQPDPDFVPESWEALDENERAEYYQMAARALSLSGKYLNNELGYEGASE